MKRPLTLLAGAVMLIPTMALANAAESTSGFTCPDTPKPVVSLTIGSRYKSDSKTHSDIDKEANKKVNLALDPVDSFISDLAGMANDAITSKEDRAARVDCASKWVAAWADAGALTKLESFGAKISVGPRLAGIALAYREVLAAGTIPAARAETIRKWFVDRGKFLETFFNSREGNMSSVNNLRAWAALAATAIGLNENDRDLIDWGKKSYELVECRANPDGSLPAEMKRGDLALHYQLHAVSALVMTAYLLHEDGADSFAACDGKIKTIVGFTLKAAKDPGIVTKINGKTQSYAKGDDKLEPFEFAWAEPYLSVVPDPALDAYVAPMRPLSHSKLGGNLTKLTRTGNLSALANVRQTPSQ